MANKPKVSNSKKTTQKPEYDPRKNYKWEADDEFVLTGVEFSTLYNTLKEAALSPTGTSAANLVAAQKILQDMLVVGIEEGVIKEVVPPVETASPQEDTKDKTRVRKSSKKNEEEGHNDEPEQ
jgi:hypothetical protein